jgi:GT2 family glycosyltransferase
MTRSASSGPRISVVVPHFDDLANLDKCLSALERQTIPADQFEIVVADNNSTCGRGPVERTIAGRAQLVTVSERGAGPTRNGGASVARGEILAFTDSDCVPSPEWLAEGTAALADYDFVGGRVTVSVADEGNVTPTEAFEKVFAFDFERYIKRKGFTGSGNLFVPRAIFNAVGGFGTGVSEDVDWSRRAIAKGYRLGYAPAATGTSFAANGKGSTARASPLSSGRPAAACDGWRARCFCPPPHSRIRRGSCVHRGSATLASAPARWRYCSCAAHGASAMR